MSDLIVMLLTDAFIMPTFNDVWGLVANEALAAGLFVLSSKYAGATYDLIIEGWNGCSFDPYKTESVVALISKSKRNLAAIRSMRIAFSNHACINYSISESANGVLESFDQ